MAFDCSFSWRRQPLPANHANASLEEPPTDVVPETTEPVPNPNDTEDVQRVTEEPATVDDDTLETANQRVVDSQGLLVATHSDSSEGMQATEEPSIVEDVLGSMFASDADDEDADDNEMGDSFSVPESLPLAAALKKKKKKSSQKRIGTRTPAKVVEPCVPPPRKTTAPTLVTSKKPVTEVSADSAPT